VTYRVTHRTEYRYQSDVTESYGELHLLPRDLPGQVCRESLVRIDPEPNDLRERCDFYGNRTVYFAVLEAHTLLTITAESVIDVEGRQQAMSNVGSQPWEVVRDRLRHDRAGAALEASDFLLDSPMVATSPELLDYIAPSFPPGRPLVDALAEFNSRINRDFAFKPGATAVGTSLTELLEGRAGVCQDFALLAVGCLRSLGLAARYVSGYIETYPPPGRPRLVGADASHAWASVFVPDTGWVDLDPTNDQFVGDRYVTTAWGRDYRDVSPVKGVIYTESTSDGMEVSVDVLRVDGSA
jgi:transglutaminase-like putative cysteine protease